MRKILGVLVAISAAIPAPAYAIDINCSAPLVVFGDARNGPGSSVSVRVAVDENGLGWQVFHDLRDGRVISRIDQYAVIDMRNAVNYQKPGFHRDTSWLGLLQSNRDLMMEGRLFDRDGGLYYAEKLTDFKFNPRGDLRMMSTAYCGPDPGGAIWAQVNRSTWERPPPPAPPAAVALAPPPPVQPLPVPLATSSAGDAVPILVANGGAQVAVTLGDYPLPQAMVIDTGASIMSIPRSLAAELFSRGIATAEGTTNMCIADGSCAERVRFFINKVTIGSHVIEHVEGAVAPDGAMMLLPFSVITSAGRATIDTKKGLLIFG
jgi:aspartyl protease